ncbi:secernin-3 [Diabrotica virgifera virgifera]|uniref:Secernin-3 n=1 Tax=Diabrotica virgifera virgifera TaxID=50390 RepID=A0A6P7FF81_DIAVI|nr:secernin-3 [Diabrotica virgifera virgifera]
MLKVFIRTMRQLPSSCDTFVVMPPLTKHGVIFGKNSDRPRGEVQEVVYIPGGDQPGSIKCTYIEVESAGPTKSIILSKPNWMWGAEMGANECGVVIGNEAIWTNDNSGDHDPSVKRLLGMDLLRLGLERSATSTEALEVITQLLEKYGQGGPCSNTDSSLIYHNSFLIADASIAWVLETSGKHWVAEKITSGYRNISNAVTISTKFDRHSDGIQEYAKSTGLWNGEGEFNFREIFCGESKPYGSRYLAGEKLLSSMTASNNFKETDMFKLLRDKESGICMTVDSAGSVTQGSQVSSLSSSQPNVHWFTATPDPSKSVFKSFVFTKGAVVSKHTKCSSPEEPHTLYLLHHSALEKSNKDDVQDLLRSMEAECVEELEQVMERVGDDLSELDELFKDCVETEVKFYR